MINGFSGCPLTASYTVKYRRTSLKTNPDAAWRSVSPIQNQEQIGGQMVAKGIKILSRGSQPILWIPCALTLLCHLITVVGDTAHNGGPQLGKGVTSLKLVTIHPRHGPSEWKRFYEPILPRPPGKRQAPIVTPRWLCDNKCLVILKNLKL